MQAKAHENAAKAGAGKSASAGKAAASKPQAEGVAPCPPAKPVVAPNNPSMPDKMNSELRAEVSYWRRLALIGGSLCLVTSGFFAGFVAAMMAS